LTVSDFSQFSSSVMRFCRLLITVRYFYIYKLLLYRLRIWFVNIWVFWWVLIGCIDDDTFIILCPLASKASLCHVCFNRANFKGVAFNFHIEISVVYVRWYSSTYNEVGKTNCTFSSSFWCQTLSKAISTSIKSTTLYFFPSSGRSICSTMQWVCSIVLYFFRNPNWWFCDWFPCC
jgi:hypothetical protein